MAQEESSSDSESDYGPQAPTSQQTITSTSKSTTTSKPTTTVNEPNENSTNDNEKPQTSLTAQGSINNDGKNNKKRSRKEMEQNTEKEQKEEQESNDNGTNNDNTKNDTNNDIEPPNKKKKETDTIKPSPSDLLDLNRLPSSEWYEYSWMHRKIITSVLLAPNYDFLITTSIDGVVKFWKKSVHSIEFVKEYRAHLDIIQDVDINLDGTLLATIGADKFLCLFDIATFDMITRIALNYIPSICCWIYSPLNTGHSIIAITEKNTSVIKIYKPTSSSANKLIHSINNIHLSEYKILNLKYNNKYSCCISSDYSGNIELWSTESPFDRPTNLSFEYIMETDFILYKRDRIIPTSMTISNNSELIAIKSNDNYIRLFRFKTGKLLFEINENIEIYQNEQNNDKSIYKVDSIEFGKRVAVERELNKNLIASNYNNKNLCGNIIFDISDKYIIYSTMLGIKIYHILKRSVFRLIGKQETHVRFLNISLFQGIPNINLGCSSQSQKLGIADIMESSVIVEGDGFGNSHQIRRSKEDPTIFVTGYNHNRFYMFTNNTNESDEHRDIQNEKPTKMHSKIATNATHRTLGRSGIIRTTFGDIHIKLFYQECPKTVENFTVHSINGYYNNIIFHRIVRGFMIQTGDPKGDSTGGESIWQGVFNDEFHRSLKHDRPGTISMANAGPNSNGSQFFITTTEAKWLDNKHTVFGRVTKGMDVVQAIECVKCNKINNKPVEPIKIINISVDTI